MPSTQVYREQFSLLFNWNCCSNKDRIQYPSVTVCPYRKGDPLPHYSVPADLLDDAERKPIGADVYAVKHTYYVGNR